MSTVASATQTSAGTAGTTVANKSLGKDDFLKLLVTQMQHQDPMKPLEDTAFIAQMAQFSALEQMQQVNGQLSALTAAQAGSGSIAYIGHTVTLQAPGSDTTASGVVRAVVYENGVPMLLVNDQIVSPDWVTRIDK
jgi:flagellar basal-body rod modification protein FlgD